MITARTPGAPSWVDLSTSDVEAAIAFYAALLGWHVERSETPMGMYAIGAVGELQVAGMMAAESGTDAPPAWTVFFTVADVDVALAAVQAAGGAVLQPGFDLPDGRIGVAADPTGGMFGVGSGPMPADPYLDQGIGTVRWVELLTRDPRAAAEFYRDVFRWTTDIPPTGGPEYTTFRLDGDQVAGMMRMPDAVPTAVSAFWSVYFTVDDTDAVARQTTELGGVVTVPPADSEGGRFAVLEDPQGAVFSVLANA